MTSPDTIEIPGIGQRALIIEDDGDRVLALIRSPGGAHSVGVRLDDDARRDLIRWLTTRTHLARPYTDVELARGQDDTRDQTLTLALLADRVTALEDRLDPEPPPYVPPPEPPVGSVVRTANLSKFRWRRIDDGWVLDRPGCIEFGATWDRICQQYGPVTIEHEGP